MKITAEQIQQRLAELTPQEGAALYWRCQGKTIDEIKVAMGVEETTVALLLARVYQKLGLGSLTDFQRGLVLSSDLGSMLMSQPSFSESDGRDDETGAPESVEPGPQPDNRILTLVRADDLSLSTLPELARALQRPAPPLSGALYKSPGWRTLWGLAQDVRTFSTLLIIGVLILVGTAILVPSLQGRIFAYVHRALVLVGGQSVPPPAPSSPGQPGTSPGQSLTTPYRTYTGRHSGPNSDVTLQLSPTGSKVVKISVSRLDCNAEPGGNEHTFSIDLSPGILISGGRFTTRAVPVPILLWAGHAHSMDIDGVIFDADGFGRREQALGGISFVSGDNRCNVQWWATSVAPDTDNDGWSDAAERRLGSDPNDAASTPEHWEVPTTDLFGPDVCHDSSDNNGDHQLDQADPNCVNA